MSTTPPPWPADVIHVNEDGWVLINRGQAHGVAPGLRVFVVGSATRELRDLFGAPADGGEAPVVLRTRRTYELLEIVYAEDRCAVAVAARAAAARRPEFYRGQGGELLVWVPLPNDYTWPQPAGPDDEPSDDDKPDDTYAAGGDDADDATDGAGATMSDDAGGPPVGDEPPSHGDQEDQRWEEALPLNGVSVGDIVIPAVPIAQAAPTVGLSTSAATAAAPSDAVAVTSPTGAEAPGQVPQDRQYDWMEAEPGQ